jgi:hypothetical protein
MDFEKFKWRERKSQTFDKSKISLTKAGKTYNVYDKIQEGREDTEIYPTLEKYGCIDRMMLDTKGVYADFTNFKGLREMKEQQAEADRMFNNLPLETRKIFNNDKNVFMRDGEKWLKEKIKAEETTKKAETPKAESEVNNG